MPPDDDGSVRGAARLEQIYPCRDRNKCRRRYVEEARSRAYPLGDRSSGPGTVPGRTGYGPAGLCRAAVAAVVGAVEGALVEALVDSTKNCGIERCCCVVAVQTPLPKSARS